MEQRQLRTTTTLVVARVDQPKAVIGVPLTAVVLLFSAAVAVVAAAAVAAAAADVEEECCIVGAF